MKTAENEKLSKEWIIVLVCINMTGTEKQKLLIAGKVSIS